jgi:hypothetical protein
MKSVELEGKKRSGVGNQPKASAAGDSGFYIVTSHESPLITVSTVDMLVMPEHGLLFLRGTIHGKVSTLQPLQ